MSSVIYFEDPGEFDKWEQSCLPIGNGYLGASMFGGVRTERIVLNEKTLWSGGPSKNRPDYRGGNKTDRYKYVKQIQELLAKGSYDEAKALLPELTGGKEGFGSYLLLCDAVLEFDIPHGEVINYRRQIDLDKSLYTCEFSVNGINYTREAFASYPARVIAFRFTASEPKKLGFRLSLDKTHDAEISAEAGVLRYRGELADNELHFDAIFSIHTDGEFLHEANSIGVYGATEAVIYFTAATDYDMKYPSYRSHTDPSVITAPHIRIAERLAWEDLYNEHYTDYSAIYNRVSLKINTDNVDLSADMLMEAYKMGDRAAMNTLEELYFNYGRYLLISSSRDGSLPANLQGVWNESNTPPWCCDYHINVNLQMNYWGAYSGNMAETALPLINFLNSLREPGRVTAGEYYNIKSDANNPENGWTAHTQCSPFGWTAPGWEFYWGWSTAAAAWLMRNIWEYYEFTGDTELLKTKIYPIMRESVRFYTQWLIYDEKQDRLVSSPTYSPEHGPATIGNTYEQSLIEQLFKDFLMASAALNTDPELSAKVIELLPQLKPYHIGKSGMLKEWYEEDEPGFDDSEVQKNHRHLSHLMGLYPGTAINSNTPQLMEAAIASLNDRGDESTGWARAYKLNLWARTGDGARSYSILKGLLKGCTYQNLWDFHPPFQIDGNFGGAAGMTEMLLQSHEGVIKLLPAIPPEWKSGEFRGLCARGGFTVNAKWVNGIVVSAQIYSASGGDCSIVYAAANGITKTVSITVGKGETVDLRLNQANRMG